MKTIEERIAKHLNVEVSKVNIGESEYRENWKGKKLESGCPVYVTMDTGVDNEEVNEFFGWIINKRWIKENC
jgi:hypothetical protein